MLPGRLGWEGSWVYEWDHLESMMQEWHLPGKGEREGQHKLFAIITTVSGLSLHQCANRAGGQRVSSLNVLVNGGSTIQRLVPTFIFDAQGKNLVPCDSSPARSVETTFLSVQKPQLLNCCSALGSKCSIFTSKRFLPLAFHSVWSSLKWKSSGTSNSFIQLPSSSWNVRRFLSSKIC